jgi:transposase
MMIDLPLFSQPKTAPAHKTSLPFRDKWRLMVDALMDELRAGASMCEACQRSGLNRKTVYRWIKSYDDFAQLIYQSAQQGRKRSTKAYAPNNFGQNIDELVDYLSKGLTLKDACSLSGISQTFVHEHRRKDKAFRDRINQAHQYSAAGKTKCIQEGRLGADVVNMGHRGNSYLYIVSAEGSNLIKIGVSSKPRSRLRSLQCGSPLRLKFDLLIKGAGEHEAVVHAYLKSKGLHSHGEWFQGEAKHEALELLKNIDPNDGEPERDVMVAMLAEGGAA